MMRKLTLQHPSVDSLVISERTLGFVVDISYLRVDKITGLCQHFGAIRQ
jgi:hypothetical protein